MAFDFGMTRIGVAVGDSVLRIPHPIAVVSGKNKFEKFAKIKDLVDKWQPTLFIVGIPENEQEFENSDNTANNTKVYCHSSSQQRSASANATRMDSRQVRSDKIQLITNIKRFSNRLKEQFKLPVTFVNEEYSSSMASSKLNEQSVFAMKQKDKLDAVSATVILQHYFDNMSVSV